MLFALHVAYSSVSWQDRDTREQKRHIATAAAAAAAAAGAAASDAQAASAAAVADVVAKGAPPAGSSSTQGCHFFGPNFYDKLFKVRSTSIVVVRPC